MSSRLAAVSPARPSPPTELIWTGGSAADERRARVFPRMLADPTGFPDAVGQGPFGPCDEQARRLLLGEA